MKEVITKIANLLRKIFGYGIVTVLISGGCTFFGYLVALIIGGERAALICRVIYQIIIPVIIKLTTILILLGLVVMYLSGEAALTATKKSRK